MPFDRTGGFVNEEQQCGTSRLGLRLLPPLDGVHFD
jgi:hypothetical protein